MPIFDRPYVFYGILICYSDLHFNMTTNMTLLYYRTLDVPTFTE